MALALDDMIRKTLETLTHLVGNIEDDNRDVIRRHYKFRFPFLN